MVEFVTHSASETVELGKELIKYVTPGKVFALFGQMGSGKTCLTTGIASALGFDNEVSSPTFAVVNEYLGGQIPIAHFDMYRVNDWNDLYSTGFFEYIDRGFLLIVEWSENIESALPDDCIKISLSHLDDNSRLITVCEE